jgi:hypothetical protein
MVAAAFALHRTRTPTPPHDLPLDASAGPTAVAGVWAGTLYPSGGTNTLYCKQVAARRDMLHFVAKLPLQAWAGGALYPSGGSGGSDAIIVSGGLPSAGMPAERPATASAELFEGHVSTTGFGTSVKRAASVAVSAVAADAERALPSAELLDLGTRQWHVLPPMLRGRYATPAHTCAGTHPAHTCTGPGLTPPTPAPGLGSPRPHLHRAWAHPAHTCAGTGLTPPTPAPGLGSPRPHLRRDWAHTTNTCSGTGLATATCMGTGLACTGARTRARRYAHACAVLGSKLVVAGIPRETAQTNKQAILKQNRRKRNVPKPQS